MAEQQLNVGSPTPKHPIKTLTVLASAAALLLLLASLLRTAAAVELPRTAKQMLTSVSACPDRKFTCVDPVRMDLSPDQMGCVPFADSVSELMGSFVVTWADSASLPGNTVVGVCTDIVLWSHPSCQGPSVQVPMPNPQRLVLQLKKATCGTGQPFRLGYHGPDLTHASVFSISCSKMVTWRTGPPAGDLGAAASLNHSSHPASTLVPDRFSEIAATALAAEVDTVPVDLSPAWVALLAPLSLLTIVPLLILLLKGPSAPPLPPKLLPRSFLESSREPLLQQSPASWLLLRTTGGYIWSHIQAVMRRAGIIAAVGQTHYPETELGATGENI